MLDVPTIGLPAIRGADTNSLYRRLDGDRAELLISGDKLRRERLGREIRRLVRELRGRGIQA